MLVAPMLNQLGSVAALDGCSYRIQSPGRISRLGFFNFQSSRTLPKIAASAITINPTTHRLRATVKNRKRNAIVKV
jgi:hypothetical protein